MKRSVVIGCGWAGAHHLRTAAESRYTRLVAAVEPDGKKGGQISWQYGIPVYKSLPELLESKTEFEIGIVATLPDLHKSMCEMLIEAGKDILCEKPVCRSSAEILFLQRKAFEAGTRFGVVFNQRYGPAVQKAKEQLEADGSTMHLITASMYQHWPVVCGGHIQETFMITDACCHLLDLVTYFAGKVCGVKAVAVKNESELYSDVIAVLTFENGCIGSISHTNVGGKLDTQHPFQCVDIHTKNARYCIENQSDRLTVYPHDGQMRKVWEPSVFCRHDYAVSMQMACEDYLRAVDTGQPLPADIHQAAENMHVLEAVLASARSEIN